VNQPDFDATNLYRRAQEIISFIYGLEDRFPDSELPILYSRLRGAAVDLGTSIAEGLARDGVTADGTLSGAARREARGRLGALRHLVLTSAAQFLLDEHHVRDFQRMHDPLREALAPRQGDPG
jgi:hypothetical protein